MRLTEILTPANISLAMEASTKQEAISDLVTLLNANGELCGLLFDGTFDTVASDFLFDPVKTRSIQVDTRYMLWVMSDVDGAQPLVTEMELK